MDTALTVELLIDSSARARLDQAGVSQTRADEIANWIADGRVAVCLPFLLEAGYSARNAANHADVLEELLSLPRIHIDAAVERRALDAQSRLARVGHHYLPPVDLLIAAAADVHTLGMIYHLAYRGDWEEARASGEYRQSTKGRTLEEQGFIHACASSAQVDQVANAFYRGDSNLLVLVIDEAKLRAEVRYDPVPGFDSPLPHIYGPLNTDAVVDAVPLEAGDDGRFRFQGPT